MGEAAGEAAEPVDNLGGILSVVLVGTIVLSINFLPLAGYQKLAVGLLVVAVIGPRVSVKVMAPLLLVTCPPLTIPLMTIAPLLVFTSKWTVSGSESSNAAP